ncbi:hypothetical protein CVT25_014330 [Psilocybe cyanescens]|uniref:Uncharacterized protein n=1 Tax=Psilocybe cyanescens TaxID=93625 RepID=A0A409XL32_PSICY|nr:hypothetical protein CVT25_014330 [Psilocybe cyanescens]
MSERKPSERGPVDFVICFLSGTLPCERIRVFHMAERGVGAAKFIKMPKEELLNSGDSRDLSGR